MKEYSKIDNFYLFSVYIFAFLFSFGLHITNLAASIFVFTSILYFFVSKDKKISINSEQKIILALFLILYLLTFSGIFYFGNTKRSWQLIFLKIYLFLIPISVVVNKKILSSNLEKIFNFFILGNFISSLLLIIRAIFRSVIIQKGHIFFSAAEQKNVSFFRSVVNGGNHFFYTDFSFFYHPSYISLFTLFIIAILLFFKINEKGKLNKIIYKNKLFLIIFFSIMLFLYNSKANILAMGVLYFYYILTSSIRKKILYILLFCLIFIGFLFINPRTSSFYQNLKKNPDRYVKKEGLDRIYIWKASVNVLKSHLLIGVGVGNVQDYLQKEYDTQVKVLKGDKYNCHNEFFQISLENGLFGLSVFLLFLFVIFLQALRTKNLLLIAFLLLIVVNFLFESMLSRVAGVMFFSFFLSLLVFADIENDKENIYLE